MKICKDTGRNAFYHLQFYLVLCVNHTDNIFDTSTAQRITEITQGIAESFDIQISSQKTRKNHTVIQFNARPATVLSRFVNSLKSVSSRTLRKEFPGIKTHLAKKSLWVNSYFLCTVPANEHAFRKAVNRYIADTIQGLE